MGSKDESARSASSQKTGSLSALITDPPSPAKLELIREFLRVVGIQADIDSGDFLVRNAGPLFERLGKFAGSMKYGEAFSAPMRALRQAYAKHRLAWQREYEEHINWEFAEDELREIVRFFGSAARQHYLESRGRTAAYVATNTEALEAEVIAEARRILELQPD